VEPSAERTIVTVNREWLRVEATDTVASVTPLELFFDLVLVLALTRG
jgi:low temperature requirement protein LtrA